MSNLDALEVLADEAASRAANAAEELAQFAEQVRLHRLSASTAAQNGAGDTTTPPEGAPSAAEVSAAEEVLTFKIAVLRVVDWLRHVESFTPGALREHRARWAPVIGEDLYDALCELAL
jgi:hypothetical protein